MTRKERGRVVRLTGAMHYIDNTELSSHEETRSEFKRTSEATKRTAGRVHTLALGTDVHHARGL